jgi:hypothetical protein
VALRRVNVVEGKVAELKRIEENVARVQDNKMKESY